MTNPPNIDAIIAELSEAQRADIAGNKWYLASCDRCGWYGSSQECGTDSVGDDSSVYCPKCGHSAADCGEIAEKFGDLVRSALIGEVGRDG